MTIYRSPDNLPVITYPLSVDATIQALQVELSNKLTWLQYSFGRAFIGKDEQGRSRGKDYTYPAVYKGSKNYQDASPNDNVISQSFFVVDGDYEYTDYDINNYNKFTLPISLIVWGNLKKIAPSTDEHLGQVLLQDVLRVIRGNEEFKVVSITDNESDVFEEFSVREEHTHLFYYPFFCYRIRMEMAGKEDCDADILNSLGDYGVIEVEKPEPIVYSNTIEATLDFTI